MAVKLHLISSLVAVLVICVIADLPTEGNDVLDSNVELESFDSGFALQDNIEEINNLRQMREAIAEPKKSSKDPENQKKKNGNQKPKTKGEQNPSRRKGNKSKGKKRKGSKKTNHNGKKGNKTKGKKEIKRKGKTVKKRKGKKSKQSKQNSKANRKRKGKKANKNKQKSNNNQNRKAKKKSKSKTKGQRNKKPNTKSKGKKSKQSESRRSKSKGGGKSGKGKKGGKNSGNRGRKSKKEGKRNKKGGRKSKKYNGKRKSNGNPRPRQTTATVNLTCLRDAVTYTKFLKDNVINFLRRNTRLTAQTATTNKKAAKKGEFKEPAARLIQSGGGDKTNLSCSGSTTSVGAKKIKSLTDKLDACEISIKNTCKPPSSINSTTLATCQKNAIAFNKTVSACIVKATKGQDACSCFQDAEVAKEKKVLQSCKGTSEAKAAAKARTACLKVISGCKNASTEAATIQYACSYSTDHLLKTLKQLTANLATFGALIDKIKELTGLSPTVGPGASNSTTGRQARSDEEKEEEAIFDSHQARLRGKRQQQECSTITTTITTCTTTISNKPASADVVTSCKAPTFTIGTCSAADKTAIVAQLNDAIDKNAIIIAFIASVVAELKAITGTTPKASDLTSATAKASARSRSVLRKMIMEKMNLRN